MKSKEYIFSQIEILVKKFPDIKCIYEFDTFDNTHVIEILPLQVYSTNESFKDAKNALFLDFISKYQDEGLFIISTNSDYKISNPILRKEGSLYQPYNSIKHNKDALLPEEIKLEYINSSKIPTFKDYKSGEIYINVSEITNKIICEESYCFAA